MRVMGCNETCISDRASLGQKGRADLESRVSLGDHPVTIAERHDCCVVDGAVGVMAIYRGQVRICPFMKNTAIERT